MPANTFPANIRPKDIRQAPFRRPRWQTCSTRSNWTKKRPNRYRNTAISGRKGHTREHPESLTSKQTGAKHDVGTVTGRENPHLTFRKNLFATRDRPTTGRKPRKRGRHRPGETPRLHAPQPPRAERDTASGRSSDSLPHLRVAGANALSPLPVAGDATQRTRSVGKLPLESFCRAYPASHTAHAGGTQRHRAQRRNSSQPMKI